MTSTAEIAEAFTSLCARGEFVQAGEDFWSPDVVSLEAFPGEMAVCKGIDAVRAKGAWWYANFEVHQASVEGPFVHGDQFALHFTIEATQKGGERTTMSEIGLYTIKDGKIIEERFFPAA
jgi:hypothetical protein